MRTSLLHKNCQPNCTVLYSVAPMCRMQAAKNIIQMKRHAAGLTKKYMRICEKMGMGKTCISFCMVKVEHGLFFVVLNPARRGSR